MLNKQADEIRKQDSMNQEPSVPETPKRRKLVSSAISASAIIVTAASRPAWATGMCTRSGLNSANLSGRHKFEGCGRSSGRWKTQQHLWPTDVSPATLFTTVFGSWSYKGNTLFANQTLGQVIMLDGGSNANPGNIGMHVVGAYVNAHAFPKSSQSGKGYVYSPEEVVNMFVAAANASNTAGNKTALQNLKNLFDAANNLYDGTTVWP
ncbi:MAG: hypothetical protein Q8N89_00050 [Azonexus sp.]|nr:hypothetical protein [Azonexus sp.]